MLFTIWKNGSPSNYAEIAAKHKEYFIDRKKKKTTTIRGIVSDIRRLEQATNRLYLYDSGGRPKTYTVDEQFVQRQQTAVILLELDKGYKKLCPDIPLEWDIDRKKFEEYIYQTYSWNQDFISGRIDDANTSLYLSFKELEPGKHTVIVEDRLDDDIEYLKLVVKDYYQDLRQREPHSSVIAHLAALLALYHPSNSSSEATGEEA